MGIYLLFSQQKSKLLFESEDGGVSGFEKREQREIVVQGGGEQTEGSQYDRLCFVFMNSKHDQFSIIEWSSPCSVEGIHTYWKRQRVVFNPSWSFTKKLLRSKRLY